MLYLHNMPTLCPVLHWSARTTGSDVCRAGTPRLLATIACHQHGKVSGRLWSVWLAWDVQAHMMHVGFQPALEPSAPLLLQGPVGLQWQLTFLQLAVRKGSVAMVQLLLSSGADIHALDIMVRYNFDWPCCSTISLSFCNNTFWIWYWVTSKYWPWVSLRDTWVLQGESVLHSACQRHLRNEPDRSNSSGVFQGVAGSYGMASEENHDESEVQCQIVETLFADGANINAKDDLVYDLSACPLC